jgi:hypothetical protein
MLSKKHLMSAAAGAVAMASLGLGAVAFADTAATSGASQLGEMHRPGVGGTVTAVSGNTITVTGMDGKTYTIDASGAAITKDMTVGVSDIKVGDTIGAQGTVNGTSVTATNIHDGKMPMMGGKGFGHGRGHGIHGTVTSISGNTLTVTATNPQDNTTSTYTVDASSAKVLKGDGTGRPTDSTLSAVAVGDEVMVAGEVSGTSITAKMLVDGPMPKFGPGQGTPMQQ